ncbi:MAG: DUF1259 domain-containing protein, partial [Acidobacteria bacterium]|nr:DUF1259 domain-containing protein [Acidobacteriota bacterium]
ELGLIEQWGSGIQRMTAACREAGLADPVLEEIGTRFRVTLATVRTHAPSIDDLDQDIRNALVDGDFAMTKDELQGVLKALRKAGINIVAIHNHMTHEDPQYVFPHY